MFVALLGFYLYNIEEGLSRWSRVRFLCCWQRVVMGKTVVIGSLFLFKDFVLFFFFFLFSFFFYVCLCILVIWLVIYGLFVILRISEDIYFEPFKYFVLYSINFLF